MCDCLSECTVHSGPTCGWTFPCRPAYIQASCIGSPDQCIWPSSAMLSCLDTVAIRRKSLVEQQAKTALLHCTRPTCSTTSMSVAECPLFGPWATPSCTREVAQCHCSRQHHGSCRHSGPDFSTCHVRNVLPKSVQRIRILVELVLGMRLPATCLQSVFGYSWPLSAAPKI